MSLLERVTRAVSSRIDARREASALTAAEAADRRAHPAVYAEVDRLIASYRSEGGLGWHLQAYKLASLFRLLDDLQPASIVEFGSGLTTAVFARYARDHGIRFASVDESEQWSKVSGALAGDGVEQHVSPRYVEVDGPERAVIGYAERPAGPFDLVFIDGPDLRVGGVKIKTAVHLEHCDYPEARWVVVDGRRATVFELERQGWRVERSDLIGGAIRDGYRYFSIGHAVDLV